MKKQRWETNQMNEYAYACVYVCPQLIGNNVLAFVMHA